MFNFRIFGYDFYYIFYTFILYSIAGWVYETTYCSISRKCFVNRGFLNGPIIPIYGFGAVLICIILSPVSHHYLLLFVGGMFLATLLEYVTSFLMEKIFHAKWWDYSERKFNIQGRICLSASLFWGVLAVVMTYFLKPISNDLIDLIPRRTGQKLAMAIMFVGTVDLVVTILSTLSLNRVLLRMHNMREELVTYLEKSRVYASKEELGKLLEGKTLTEAFAGIKEKVEKLKEKKESRVHYLELEEKITAWRDKYGKHSEQLQLVQKRLLRAFPNMKSTKHEFALNDIKIRLKELKKIKKENIKNVKQDK